MLVYCALGERERERESERERERERQTDRQTEKVRRKWRHHRSAEISNEFTLPLTKVRTSRSAPNGPCSKSVLFVQKICTLLSASLNWHDKCSKNQRHTVHYWMATQLWGGCSVRWMGHSFLCVISGTQAWKPRLFPINLQLRPCGFFFLCFSSGSESKINAGRKEKNKHRKKTASHPMYPANQQNLDTKLATAKLWLAIHSASNSAEVKTLCSDCLKRHPLRKHVQEQISGLITDHWVHGDLQCRSTWSTICFVLFFSLQDSPNSMHAIDEKQTKKKRHGLKASALAHGTVYEQWSFPDCVSVCLKRVLKTKGEREKKV